MKLSIISGWGICGDVDDINVMKSVMVPLNISGWGTDSGGGAVRTSWMILLNIRGWFICSGCSFFDTSLYKWLRN